jgi:hypothetical protein
MPQLGGVSVEAYILINRPEIQDRRLQQWWDEVLVAAGVKHIVMMPVEG